jgi:hypothetical protein
MCCGLDIELRLPGKLFCIIGCAVLFNIPLNLVDARMGMASRATAGTIRDCNSNGLDDGAEITAYTSPDCNGNYVPDECDLVAGTSRDCDGSGRPDACELCGFQWSALKNEPGAIEYRLNGIYTLMGFDDGTGMALYAGGYVSTYDGSTFENIAIARWNGTGWSSLGSGMDDLVFCLATYDDGTGPALYAGGDFLYAGGVSVNHVAKWDGQTWSELGSGINGDVRALAVYDDGTGEALYAAGQFIYGVGPTSDVIRWDGNGWTAFSGGSDWNGVVSLAVYDDGTGPGLYAGGVFSSVDGVPANNIARWDGTQWSPLGNGFEHVVWAQAVYDDGDGPALYVGGRALSSPPDRTTTVKKWDGSTWTQVGGEFNNEVSVLAVVDDGNGPALYAAGTFWRIDGEVAGFIARWDGTAWRPVGGGEPVAIPSPSPISMTAKAGGSTPVGVSVARGALPPAASPRGQCTVDNDCNRDGILNACEPDQDGDLIPDACDLCLGGVASGDADGDGRMSIADYAIFEQCLFGPTATLDPACDCFDLDNDGDSDLVDFAAFQSGMEP